MIIKTKQTWKDLIDKPQHQSWTRRDFLARGLATGALSVALPKFLIGDWVRQAHAATSCPAPSRALGSISQIFASGGPTMGARFISEQQASMMTAAMASNYGISGQSNLVKLGPNMVIDSTSPFGFTILQGPPGYPGGASAWKSNVLSKISGGGHLGPFNADDGAGENTGLLGAVSPFKPSQMSKDLRVGVNNTIATWATSSASSSVSRSGLSPTSLANVFNMTPAASGLTTPTELSNASDAANALASAMDPVLKISSRKAGTRMIASAGCAFYGNSALADPTYGSKLFDPANVSALTSKMTVANLTAQEQALLAAYYQSASGVAGGVVTQFNGRDYHGQSPQNVVAPTDIEDARAIVMFLAACEAAQAPGAMIYLSNGQAISSGTQAVTATINGAAANLNSPVPQGDAGGSYNAGLIIFFDPKGSPPQSRFTGTVASASGNAKTDSKITSSQDAVAGLYLSAMSWVTGSVPNSALTAMRSVSLASNTSNIMVI